MCIHNYLIFRFDFYIRLPYLFFNFPVLLFFQMNANVPRLAAGGAFIALTSQAAVMFAKSTKLSPGTIAPLAASLLLGNRA